MLLTVQIQPGPSRNEAPFESPLARLCPVVRSLKKHVPVVESRPAAFCSGDLPERAIEIDHSHAGFPQGLFDATNLISLSIRFVASWLTNAIDRIVKERPPELAKPGANSTRALSDSNRPDLVMIYRHHRPVQACPLAARPGRCLASICEQGNLNPSSAKPEGQPSTSRFFQTFSRLLQSQSANSGIMSPSALEDVGCGEFPPDLLC